MKRSALFMALVTFGSLVFYLPRFPLLEHLRGYWLLQAKTVYPRLIM